MAENNPDWASCQAFHCYVPLGSQGCTISVGKISESTKNQLLQMKTTKGVTDSLLYGIEEIRLLKNHLSLHVPRGAALFLDAREFTCGVNVQKDRPTLFGIFSLAGAPLETPRRPAFLRRYLPYPNWIKSNRNPGSDDEDTVSEGSNDETEDEENMVVDDATEEERPTVKGHSHCRHAYNKLLIRAIEAFSPTIKTVNVAEGVEFNNNFHDMIGSDFFTWPA